MAEITKSVIDTLIAEAGGEGDIGLIAAAWAMQQRAAARGQTLDQVVRSGFDGFTNPGSASRQAQKDPSMRARAERILSGVTTGQIPNPVQGADHFLSGDVMPEWATKMRHVATIGGHRYYASGNVPRSSYGVPMPPEDIPQVASLLDVVPTKEAPVPVQPSGRTQTYRQPGWSDALSLIKEAQMGTPDMGSINALYATPPQPRAPITQNDLIFQSGIADTVSGAQAIQAGQGDLASALERMLRPTLPTRSAQELAGIYADGGPTRPPVAAPRTVSPAQVAAAGAGSPWTDADGPKVSQRRVDVASAPRTQSPPSRSAQDITAISAGTNWGASDGPAVRVATSAPKPPQSPAPTPASQSTGLEVSRAPGVTVATIPTASSAAFAPAPKLPVIGPTGGSALNAAPRPASQTIDLAIRRAPTQSVSLVPTVQTSGVGQPPATKTVQSIPVTAAPKTAQTVPRGMPTSSRSRDAVANQKAGTRTAAMFGSGNAKEVVASPAKPNPTGYGSGHVKTDNVRLAGGVYPASVGSVDGIGQMPRFADLAGAPQIQVAAAPTTKPVPVPRPHSERPYGVGSQLAVTPPVTRNVPVPRPRPAENPFGDFVNTAIQNIPVVRMANHLNTMMLGNGYQRGAPGSGVMYQPVNLSQAPKSQQATEFLQRVHGGGDSGYTSLGNGSFADASGGVYYDRHIK